MKSPTLITYHNNIYFFDYKCVFSFINLTKNSCTKVGDCPIFFMKTIKEYHVLIPLHLIYEVGIHLKTLIMITLAKFLILLLLMLITLVFWIESFRPIMMKDCIIAVFFVWFISSYLCNLTAQKEHLNVSLCGRNETVLIFYPKGAVVQGKTFRIVRWSAPKKF